jgi:hypothetical protein
VSLAESLDELVRQHDEIGSPLRRQLAPGIARRETASRIGAIGLSAPEELLELFEWRSYQARPDRVAWFWPAIPYTLDEAVDAYRTAMRMGGITQEEFDRLDVTGRASTFTGFWRQDWFPIFQGSPEEYAVACSGRPGVGQAPVWRVNWHPDARFETIEVAPSLETFLGRIVDLFRAGGYEWSAVHQAIVPVEAVFERRGLAATMRP